MEKSLTAEVYFEHQWHRFNLTFKDGSVINKVIAKLKADFKLRNIKLITDTEQNIIYRNVLRRLMQINEIGLPLI